MQRAQVYGATADVEIVNDGYVSNEIVARLRRLLLLIAAILDAATSRLQVETDGTTIVNRGTAGRRGSTISGGFYVEARTRALPLPRGLDASLARRTSRPREATSR